MTEEIKRTIVEVVFDPVSKKELTLEQMLRKFPISSNYLKNIGLIYGGMPDRVEPKKTEAEVVEPCLPESR